MIVVLLDLAVVHTSLEAYCFSSPARIKQLNAKYSRNEHQESHFDTFADIHQNCILLFTILQSLELPQTVAWQHSHS